MNVNTMIQTHSFYVLWSKWNWYNFEEEKNCFSCPCPQICATCPMTCYLL